MKNEFDKKTEKLAESVALQVKELFLANHNQMQKIMMEEGSSRIRASFVAEFEDMDGGTVLKTGISFSQKFKDEREEFVDPNQTKLPFVDSQKTVGEF